ncbi:lipid A phosphoethanolamine transferase [Flavobacterium sp. DGU38]|uniref:Lipid A phosphoethanolamine transferase n=1 Tax=Flavobacterium calami TaxID=3139144 RepID=A0ABU9IQK9_9FLAO
MKNTLTFLLLSFIFCTSLKAQDTIVQKKNIYTEARYHYYLKTILLFNEYLDTDKGSFNTTQLRFLHPIASKAWNLRVDLPLVSTNTNSDNKTGIGDIGAGLSYIPYMKYKDEGIAFRARVISNSAADPAIGTGKWVFSPAFFFGKYFTHNILWITSLENQISFAGSKNRNDINLTTFENYFMYIFGSHWIAGDVAFRYNAINKGYPNNAYLEFGKRITKNDIAYIHPSVAFGNHKTYNFGLEVGMLILF